MSDDGESYGVRVQALAWSFWSGVIEFRYERLSDADFGLYRTGLGILLSLIHI